MGSSESDPTVPKDELLAALADVENRHGEQAAHVASPDDRHEDAEDSTAALAAPQPRHSASQTENTTAPDGADVSGDEAEINAALDQLEAFAADIEALSAGADTSGPTAVAVAAETGSTPTSCESLGDEQLRAASAEVETISSSPKDGASRHVATAGGDSNEPGSQESSHKPGPAELTSDGRHGEETPAATAEAKQKRPRFTIGKRSTDEAAAESRPSDEAGETGASQSVAPPVTPLARRVYRAVERGLDRINRPFATLDDGKRALVGWAAMTTLIVSILAMVLIPKILPHRDAVTFLQEKRAQLDAPFAPEPDDSPHASSPPGPPVSPPEP